MDLAIGVDRRDVVDSVHVDHNDAVHAAADPVHDVHGTVARGVDVHVVVARVEHARAAVARAALVHDDNGVVAYPHDGHEVVARVELALAAGAPAVVVLGGTVVCAVVARVQFVRAAADCVLSDQTVILAARTFRPHLDCYRSFGVAYPVQTFHGHPEASNQA